MSRIQTRHDSPAPQRTHVGTLASCASSGDTKADSLRSLLSCRDVAGQAESPELRLGKLLSEGSPAGRMNFAKDGLPDPPGAFFMAAAELYEGSPSSASVV